MSLINVQSSYYETDQIKLFVNSRGPQIFWVRGPLIRETNVPGTLKNMIMKNNLLTFEALNTIRISVFGVT